MERLGSKFVRVEYMVRGFTHGKTMDVCSKHLQTSETTAKPAAKSLTPETKAEAEVKQRQFNIHMKAAERALSRSDWDKAIHAFTKAIDLKGTFRGYAGRASALIRRDNLFLRDEDKAEEDLNKALEIEPQNLQALCDRGELRFKMDKFDEAAEDFNKILRIIPNDGRALCGLGDVKMAEDDKEGALSYFDDARSAWQVNYPYVWERRAAALRAVKKQDKHDILRAAALRER